MASDALQVLEILRGRLADFVTTCLRWRLVAAGGHTSADQAAHHRGGPRFAWRSWIVSGREQGSQKLHAARETLVGFFGERFGDSGSVGLRQRGEVGLL